MIDHNIISKSLRDVRESRSISLQSAAEASRIPYDRLQQIELSNTTAELWELKSLASTYCVELSHIMRGEGSTFAPTIIDFRTLDNRPASLSIGGLHSLSKFTENIRFLSKRVGGFNEYALYNHFNIEQRPSYFADELRRFFPIPFSLQEKQKRPITIYNYLRALIEIAGVPVYQQKQNIEDFRGFCVSEKDAFSAIFVNTAESTDGAKAFTLIHELAHLSIGMPGISDPYRSETHDKEEQFCNSVAAHFLAPDDRLDFAVDKARAGKENPLALVASVSRTLGVSEYMSAIRIEESGLGFSGFTTAWKNLANEKWGSIPDFKPFARSKKDSDRKFKLKLGRLGISITNALHFGFEIGKINSLHLIEKFNLPPEYLNDTRRVSEELANTVRSLRDGPA